MQNLKWWRFLSRGLTITVLLVIIFPAAVRAQRVDSLSPEALQQTIQLLERQLVALKQELAARLAHGAQTPGTVTTVDRPCLNLTRDLALGARDTGPNGEVFRLQSFLRDTGDYFYPGLTGYFGEQTQTAVQSFQRREEIVSFGRPETTGYGAVGQATRARIRALGCGEFSVPQPASAISTDSDNSPDYSITAPFPDDVTPQKFPDLFVRGIARGTYGNCSGTECPVNYVFGTEPNPTFGKPTLDNYTSYYDHCAGSNQLNEGYRMNDYKINSASFPAPAGYVCRNGVFVSTTSVSPTTTLTITGPTASTVWRSDAAHTITWSSAGFTASTPANIQIYTANSLLYRNYNTGITVNNRSFTLPANTFTTAGAYYLNINAGAISRRSDTFMITTPTSPTTPLPPAQPATLTVSSPPTNSQWTVGNGPVIQWSFSNIPAGNLILVELLTPSGGNVPGFNNFSTANDGSQSGNLTNSVVPSGWYYFRLSTHVNGQTIYGGSGIFQFTGADQSTALTPPAPTPTITISNPTNSSVWTADFSHRVDWTSTNLPAGTALLLELLTPAGAPGFASFSTADDGNQFINLSNVTPGYYYIRLKTTVNGQTIYGGSQVFQVISTAPPAATYALTASAGSGGTISPAGVTIVNAGGAQTYSITPNSGYQISDVRVNGSSVGVTYTYRLYDIRSNQTIAAYFTAIAAPTTYRIVASASAGGTISPTGTVTINAGASRTFIITPSVGYRLSNVYVNGVTVDGISSTGYTFSNVQANQTIDARFVVNEVAPPAQPATLTVSSPPTNSQWTVGNGPVIQWSFSNIPAGNLILVELLTPSGGNVPGFNNFSTANDGSQSGNLTNSVVPSGWYYFRLSTHVNGQTIYGGSGIFQFTGADQSTAPTTTSDLIISAPATLTVSPTSVVAGQAVTLPGWIGKNQGNAAASAFTIGFYLSSDVIIDVNDTYITGASALNGLAAGATFSAGGPTLTIPASIPAGSYYIGILMDRQNVITESDESNNYKSAVLRVTR